MTIGILALLAAVQAGPTMLQPAEPWQVSTEVDGCRASRSFGDDRRITLGFESNPARTEPSLSLAGPKAQLPGGVGELTVTPAGQAPFRIHFGAFQVADNSQRLLKLFPDAAELAQLAAAPDVKIGDDLPALHTGGFTAALGALEKCNADLLASWGVDPTLYRKHQMARLTGNVALWFSGFPHDARGRGGLVMALLTTEPDGSLSGCKAVVKVEPSVDAATCTIAMAHIRVRPAHDDAGQPVAGYALLPVRWARP